MQAGKHYRITIRYNNPIGDFKAIEHRETICGEYAFTQGNLHYFRKDAFNIFTIAKEEIESITEI